MNPTKKIVLVVEDEGPILRVLTDNLTTAGFEVLQALNGEAGLAMATEHKPDLILLDILMPKMDGLEFLKALRREEWGKGVPVIILSNVNETAKIAEALEGEVFEYFVKADTKIEDIIKRIKEKLTV